MDYHQAQKSSFVRRPALRKQSGFTLVELLVVIAIIAVLISILLPALNKARRAAQAVACASQMRQIGLSIALYGNQFKNYIVPIGPDTTIAGWDNANWITILAGSNCGPYKDQIIGAGGISLRGPSPLYRCPGDDSVPASTIAGSGVYIAGLGTSYFGNFRVMYDATASGGQGMPATTLYYAGPWKFSAFHNSAYRILLVEKTMADASTFIGITSTTARDRIYNHLTGATNIATRHGSSGLSSNVLFLDGHVEPMGLKDLQQPAIDSNLAGSVKDVKPLWGTGPS